MTTQPRPLPTPLDHTLHLAPRQLQVMRTFWNHGAGTVHDLRRWLITDPPLAYTTLMSVCVRLHEKGLLNRRKLNEVTEKRSIPYLYMPTLSEAEYARRTIGRSIQRYVNRSDADAPNQPDRPAIAHQLAELSGVPLVDGQQTIATLLERAEAAEHAAAQAAVALYEATERVAALERRAEAAERRSEMALRALNNWSASSTRRSSRSARGAHHSVSSWSTTIRLGSAGSARSLCRQHTACARMTCVSV